MKIETALEVLKECQIDVTCHKILGKELTQIQFGILLALTGQGRKY